MKIALIRPNMGDVRSSDAMHPLCFAVLASLTPADVELELFDECLEPIRYDQPADLVAMTVETYTARNAYQIAARFRRRGVPVVMGGHHPTLLPDEALQHADSVVVGDAEGIWQEVVRDAQSGGLRQVYRQPEMPSLAGPMAKREIFRGRRYAPLDLVQFGRGCRFACDFCSIHAFYGTSLRWRPVGEVVAEIESLRDRHLLFVNDNLLADVSRAEDLFRALAPLRIRWSCQTSINVCRESRLLKLMAESGCQTMLIGFESLDERNLQQMKKQWALKGGDYAVSIRKLHDHGIMIYGTFVFGYDYDTVELVPGECRFCLAIPLLPGQFQSAHADPRHRALRATTGGGTIAPRSLVAGARVPLRAGGLSAPLDDPRAIGRGLLSGTAGVQYLSLHFPPRPGLANELP